MTKMVREELSEAIDCALKEFASRVGLGLMCPCVRANAEGDRSEVVGNLRPMKPMREVKKGFEPVEMLGFVLKIVVSARVEPAKAVGVARAAAQVNVYRSFVSIKRDWMYRETMRLIESDSVNDDSEGNCII
ncbi:uncharacterized protein LOC143887476 [Tasmannia lanceolata]|uniref:uncharacterized protein LOC143887447 n=1 Tax=Tasmannia lanceolata TaxID=3420 RepID=UPI0040643BDF